MLIYEYRVILPMTVEEYQVAQLFSVAEASKNNTGGGEGIEVLANEPFDITQHVHLPKSPLEADGLSYTTGQFTHKIYHLQSKVPKFIRLLAPKGSLEMHEEAWNAYPYCRTIITNEYMKQDFMLSIETLHKQDNGSSENVHNLSPEKLKDRIVVTIDIAADPVSSADYKADEDPTKIKSQKTGRGPLGPNWREITQPLMCAYKLVTVNFKWWGLQKRAERFIQGQERRLFTNFHRQLFCWMDGWSGLTMEDIRMLEDRTKDELDERRKHGGVVGMTADE